MDTDAQKLPLNSAKPATAVQRVRSVNLGLRTHGLSHRPVTRSFRRSPRQRPVSKVLLTFKRRLAPARVVGRSNVCCPGPPNPRNRPSPDIQCPELVGGMQPAEQHCVATLITITAREGLESRLSSIPRPIIGQRRRSSLCVQELTSCRLGDRCHTRMGDPTLNRNREELLHKFGRPPQDLHPILAARFGFENRG